METTLTSNHYQHSPLTQGGLDIPGIVKVAMPWTLLNKKLLEIYEKTIKDIYVKPEEGAIMWSFVFDDIVMGDEPGTMNRGNQSQKKKRKERTQEKLASRHIRTIFRPAAEKRSTKPEKV